MIFWQIFVESDEERAFYNQPVISLLDTVTKWNKNPFNHVWNVRWE